MHHVVISRNIPLREFTSFVVSLADKGIIEFVSIEDEMSQLLLSRRRDSRVHYTIEQFERYLESEARIVFKEKARGCGRILYGFEKG